MLVSIIVMLVLLGVIAAMLLKNSGEPSGTGDSFTGDKVKVEFYVMSQCPYGTQVEDAIAPVLQKMGGGVDFNLDYIVRETAPGVFQSLHGDKEVKGNIVQLCAKKYYADKYFDLVICQNKDAANVDTNWESCGKSLGMDTAKLQACTDSDEGKSLLRESMQRAQARQASGSPTIYINDVAYSGGRQALDFQRAICQTSKHPACSEIPVCASDADCTAEPAKEGSCVNPGAADASCVYIDPVPVDYIVLNDAACTSCDTTRIVQASQNIFLGAKPRYIDVNSAEGKTLVEAYKIEVVPAYIFDSNVVETKSWTSSPDLGTAFETMPDGKYKLLDAVTGASYFVSEEARAAFYAAIGVEKGDNKPQIDFFVMSYCPYGNQAEEAIKPVFDLIGSAAEFNPKYVIYSNYGGGGEDYCFPGGELCSMHGRQELNQNAREACVNKYMGISKWFDFALEMNQKCNYKNADSCWEDVAKGLGLDVAKIKACEASEGVALMKADKDLGDRLGVQGSPTVFVDGEEYSSARSAEGYKQSLCAAFETAPTTCGTSLGEAVSAQAAGAAAAAPAAECGV